MFWVPHQSMVDELQWLYKDEVLEHFDILCPPIQHTQMLQPYSYMLSSVTCTQSYTQASSACLHM